MMRKLGVYFPASQAWRTARKECVHSPGQPLGSSAEEDMNASPLPASTMAKVTKTRCERNHSRGAKSLPYLILYPEAD
jgi:hypothetical protein